jgi:hypothetical protein
MTFGGGSLAGQRGPWLSSRVKDMPWWVQVAFGLILVAAFPWFSIGFLKT